MPSLRMAWVISMSLMLSRGRALAVGGGGCELIMAVSGNLRAELWCRGKMNGAWKGEGPGAAAKNWTRGVEAE